MREAALNLIFKNKNEAEKITFLSYLKKIEDKIPINEDQLQAKCFQWAHALLPDLRGILFACPNGGYRNDIERMKFMATGTVAGIPDLVYLHKAGPVGIELKFEKRSTSDSQKKIHSIWEANGIKVYICRSFEQFIDALNEIRSRSPEEL